MSYADVQIRRVFEQVQLHVLHLHGYWKLFRKLFRGNADSHPVIAAVAPQMFAQLERLLHRGVFLYFRQLIDPPVTRERRNASLHGLLEAVAGLDYATNHADLVELIGKIQGNTSIRMHVNRYVAHLDFDLLAGVDSPPPPVAILDVEDALSELRAFMDEYGRRFLGVEPVEYEWKAEVLAEQAEILVDTLRAGLRTPDDEPTVEND